MYSEFNKQTRELGPMHPGYNFKAMHYFLSAAIHDIYWKTHHHHGPYKVYRGVTHPVNTVVGRLFYFDGFASTSMDPSVAEKFLQNKLGATLFIIETYFGGKINKFSAYPHENEVLIPPCEKFKVVKICLAEKGKKEIYLKSLGMTA